MLSKAYKIKRWQVSMAVLAIHTGDSLTKDMYETLRKEVNWEGNPPPGLIFHAASFDKSGNNICVADVWESEDNWNNYLNTRLKSSFQKGNMPPPKTQIFQIHNINALPALDNYKVR
jgi:hypothetical protein